MYDSVRLEKGMYHLANRSFTQALEAADPSAQYAGTELAGLDAFERQLKRFDIHVSGENCDPVEKFFTTTESAVLFPEFVRRAIKRGMEESILPELTAAASAVSASSCKGFSVDETDGAYSATTAEGVSLKKTVITESAAIALDKYGRLISASYETIRQQRIDVFAVMLRAVGHKLAGAIAGKALDVIKNSVTPVSSATTTLTYNDLATLYAQFSAYDLTTGPKCATARSTQRVRCVCRSAQSCSRTHPSTIRPSSVFRAILRSHASPAPMCCSNPTASSTASSTALPFRCASGSSR